MPTLSETAVLVLVVALSVVLLLLAVFLAYLICIAATVRKLTKRIAAWGEELEELLLLPLKGLEAIVEWAMQYLVGEGEPEKPKARTKRKKREGGWEEKEIT